MIRTRLSDGELAALLAHLKEKYTYDDEMGTLRKVTTGRPVGLKRKQNGHYITMGVPISGRNVSQMLHRMIWLYCKGRMPVDQLDHINGNMYDNRIGNLREVSQSENNLNRFYRWKPNAVTGLPGVVFNGGSYITKIFGRQFRFRDPFTAFYHATLCGRRFKLEVRGEK